MSRRVCGVLCWALSLVGCDVESHHLGDDDVDPFPGEIVGVCVPNDAGADGGLYHVSVAKFRECTRSPVAAFGEDCPFPQCLQFVIQACEEARAQGRSPGGLCSER